MNTAIPLMIVILLSPLILTYLTYRQAPESSAHQNALKAALVKRLKTLENGIKKLMITRKQTAYALEEIDDTLQNQHIKRLNIDENTAETAALLQDNQAQAKAAQTALAEIDNTRQEAQQLLQEIAQTIEQINQKNEKARDTLKQLDNQLNAADHKINNLDKLSKSQLHSINTTFVHLNDISNAVAALKLPVDENPSAFDSLVNNPPAPQAAENKQEKLFSAITKVIRLLKNTTTTEPILPVNQDRHADNVADRMIGYNPLPPMTLVKKPE